jgi:glycosyltransferase involved in cell wall biosynthesis
MKVLFLTVRADTGGGPEHLYQLLRHLPADIVPVVACPDEPPYHERLSSIVGDGEILVLPHRSFSLFALWNLRKEVLARGIDALHSHGKGAGLYGRLLSILTGRPCVHTFHGLHVGGYGYFKKWFYLLLEGLLGLSTYRAICVSHGEREAIERAGFISKLKLIVIENGVEIPDQIAPKEESDVLRIVSVSRFDYQKNPDALLEIATSLKGRIAFSMTVLGTGGRLSEISEKAFLLGVSDLITFTGEVPDSRIYFRSADVFLTTSRWEGLPLAVIEAMSEAICVVASDVVGNHDVVDIGATGFLFNSPEQAVNQLIALAQSFDAHKLGLAGRGLTMRRFSIELMAECTAKVLRSAGADGSGND